MGGLIHTKRDTRPGFWEDGEKDREGLGQARGKLTLATERRMTPFPDGSQDSNRGDGRTDRGGGGGQTQREVLGSTGLP